MSLGKPPPTARRDILLMAKDNESYKLRTLTLEEIKERTKEALTDGTPKTFILNILYDLGALRLCDLNPKDYELYLYKLDNCNPKKLYNYIKIEA